MRLQIIHKFADEKEHYYTSEGVGIVIKYILRDKLTQGRVQYYGGLNVSPEHAVDELNYVKNYYGNDDGLQIAHLIVSYPKGMPPYAALLIAYKISYFYAKKYQVLFSVHQDNPNSTHIHIVFNTTSFVDGSRYVRSSDEVARLAKCIGSCTYNVMTKYF